MTNIEDYNRVSKEEKVKEKDWCSSFPEELDGTYIGNCCKLHDNAVGKRGTYNPITPHTEFFKCLKSVGINNFKAFHIALVAGLGSLIRYPYFVWRKYTYRKDIRTSYAYWDEEEEL